MRYLHSFCWLAAAMVAGFTVMPSSASIIHTVSGLSGTGDPVSFKAEFSISGDVLTLQISNTSTVASNSPDDVLSSFYFDIVDSSGNRPVLTYVSAVGDVYRTVKSSPDTLQTANASLRAINSGDSTWAFRTMDGAISPFLGFGIGTVGNNWLTPNGFNGLIVDGMDYSIYAGEVTTQSLHNRLLVKNTATFIFAGLTGFTEGDISFRSTFGLGTMPDSILWVPEPLTLVLLLIGGAALICRRR